MPLFEQTRRFMIKSDSKKSTRSHIDFSNVLEMNVIVNLNKAENESLVLPFIHAHYE